jgi:hypothetical protein
VFENMMLRRIFGSKREEVKRSWRKVQTKELDNLHTSPKKKR